MKVIEQLKLLSDERFLAIYESLEQNGFGPMDAEVAKSLRFRPQAVKKLPMKQRARRAQTLMQRASNAQLCYDLFGAYLMKERKELVTGFLDATGVAHEDGMLEDLDESRPAADKVREAVSSLDQSFDKDDVTLYLSMCAEQWPDIEEIDALWRERSGVAATS
jgi:hypothetical protein